MSTPIPTVGGGFSPFGTAAAFARRPDAMLAFLGSLAGASAGQALLAVVSEQQQLIQLSVDLGPPVDRQVPATLAQFLQRSTDVASVGSALASVSATILEASQPAESDLVTARQDAASLVRVYNAARGLVTGSPLVLKGELADSLKATASALETDLSSIGITISSDGTMSLDATTLASAVDLKSSSLSTAVTTLRELGSRLGALGAQFQSAPAEQLLYQPPPDPRSERAGAQPPRVPPVRVSSADVVFAYLFTKQRLQMLSGLRPSEASGALFSAVA